MGKKGGIIKQPTPIFNAFVDDKGKMKMLPYVRESMLRWISTLRGEIDFTIKKHRKKRTVDQNSYYWAIIVSILANEFGYELDEMHMILREKFLRIHDEKHPDFVIAKSTAKLTTVEFIEYIEKIQRWASIDHQIYLPDPEKAENKA